jgi:hypothetical protein
MVKYNIKHTVKRKIPSEIYWCIYYVDNTTKKGCSLWRDMEGIYEYLMLQTKRKRSVIYSNMVRLIEDKLIYGQWAGKRRQFSINKETLVELYRDRLIKRLNKRLKEYERHLKRAKRYHKEVPQPLKLSLKAIKKDTREVDKIKIPNVLASGVYSYFEKRLELPQYCLIMGTIEEEIDRLVELTFTTNFLTEKLPQELKEFQLKINKIFMLEQIKFIDALKENAQKYT